jgi:hypothetical protein
VRGHRPPALGGTSRPGAEAQDQTAPAPGRGGSGPDTARTGLTASHWGTKGINGIDRTDGPDRTDGVDETVADPSADRIDRTDEVVAGPSPGCAPTPGPQQQHQRPGAAAKDRAVARIGFTALHRGIVGTNGTGADAPYRSP